VTLALGTCEGLVSLSEPGRLWHVTVTVSGEEVEPRMISEALLRLKHHRPFRPCLRYAAERAEIQYWEEATNLLDASSLALRVWDEHRVSEGLPHWEVVGLEVLERSIFRHRGHDTSTVADLHDVRPLPF
jgi:hypothetical protein